MPHHGNRGYPKTKQIMLERRKEAQERQAEYDKLTLQEKLAKLPPEPGAKKQRARLLSLLAEEQRLVQVEKEKASKKENQK